MGTMSASGAAPLPRLGEVFFDVRGDSRSMRVSWYADTGVAVFSIWQGDTCTGTFRLPIPELPRMVEALTQGPPDRAASDPGPTTTAMGPGGMPVPAPPPDQNFPPQHGYGAPHAGYAPATPSGHQEGPPTARYTNAAPGGYQEGAPAAGYTDPGPGGYQEGAPAPTYTDTAPGGYQEGALAARYTDTAPGGYQGPVPGGQHQMPAGGYYQEPAPEGHRGLPPAGYYQGSAPEDHRDLPQGGQARSAASGYQDARHQDAPRGSYEGPGSAAPDGYQNLPPGGYQDLPPGGGYRDLPPGADYRASDDGFREPPAAAPPEGPAQFAGRQQDPYPPTGPLSVGRWRSDEPSGEFPQARPEDGFAPDGYAEDRTPADRFAPDGYAQDRTPADRFAPDGYAQDRTPADRFAPDGYAQDRTPADRFAPDEFAPDGYAGEGFAQDEFAADGFADDPLADSYQGEAEQGYLPSPPTDMFPAASLGGDYDQGSHRTGYEPDPADLDHEGPYPAGRAGRRGAPRDSGAYRPGRGGAREREYGHSRGRS
jgi:hypothetical protein